MNVKNCYFLLIITLILIGCNKEVIDKNTNELTSNNGVKNVNGILHFQSEKSFVEIMNTQSIQTEEQKNKFCDSLNFNSNKSVVREAYSCLNNAKNEDEFRELLQQYSDVLVVNGENVDPIIDDPFYSRICDRNGYFFIKETAFKITQKGTYSSKKGCLSDLEAASKENNTQIEGVSFAGKKELTNLKSVQSCGVQETDLEKINSDGDRKIRAIVRTNFYSYPVPGDMYDVGYYTITLLTRTYWKRFWWFALYENPHYISGFNVGVQSPPNSGSLFEITGNYPYYKPIFVTRTLSLANATTYPNEYEEKIWKENEMIGGTIRFYNDAGYTPPDIVPPTINNLVIKAWSRGVGENEGINYGCE